MDNEKIKAGQTWRVKNAIRPPVIVKSANRWSKVYWSYEDNMKVSYDCKWNDFLRDYELVEDV